MTNFISCLSHSLFWLCALQSDKCPQTHVFYLYSCPLPPNPILPASTWHTYFSETLNNGNGYLFWASRLLCTFFKAGLLLTDLTNYVLVWGHMYRLESHSSYLRGFPPRGDRQETPQVWEKCSDEKGVLTSIDKVREGLQEKVKSEFSFR